VHPDKNSSGDRDNTGGVTDIETGNANRGTTTVESNDR